MYNTGYMLLDFCEQIINAIFPLSREERLVLNLEGVFPLHITSYDMYITGQYFEESHRIKVTTLSDYSDRNVAALIHTLKYTQSAKSIDIISSTLADYLIEEVYQHVLRHADSRLIIMPVPLSKRRRQKRGFNQVEVLLKKVVEKQPRLMSYMATDMLVKHKETKSQTRLRREERLTNVRGAFKCIELNGAYVILIDDVLTTGATVWEASDVLVRSGAQDICIITIARTL